MIHIATVVEKRVCISISTHQSVITFYRGFRQSGITVFKSFLYHQSNFWSNYVLIIVEGKR